MQLFYIIYIHILSKGTNADIGMDVFKLLFIGSKRWCCWSLPWAGIHITFGVMGMHTVQQISLFGLYSNAQNPFLFNVLCILRVVFL